MIRIRRRDAGSGGGFPLTSSSDPGHGVRGLESNGGSVIGAGGGGESDEAGGHKSSRVRKACSGAMDGSGDSHGEKGKQREELHDHYLLLKRDEGRQRTRSFVGSCILI